jgi:hypothetical protein
MAKGTLAQSVLKEIPGQFVSYMERRNIVPKPIMAVIP